MKFFLEKILGKKYKEALINRLDIDIESYDFNSFYLPQLIASINGPMIKAAEFQTGIWRLEEVIKKFPFKNKNPLTKRFFYSSSSIGNTTAHFLLTLISNEVYNFLESLFPDFDKKIDKNQIVKIFSVIYPSEDYIKESSLDASFAQCLFLNEDTYKKPGFLKEVIKPFIGNPNYAYHHGVFPHTKIFLVLDEDLEVSDDTFIYFGSHNITSSAWGKVSKDGQTLITNNTELGVIYPPENGSALIKKKIVENLPFKIEFEEEDLKNYKPYTTN